MTGSPRRRVTRAVDALVLGGSLAASAATAHSALNSLLLRRPPKDPPPTSRRVAVLVPARDEADNLAACLASVRAQEGVPDLRIEVLDDASTDGTADVARATLGSDPRSRVTVSDAEPPPGWLGKPYACRRLADLAVASGAEVLVFVDADVVLEAHAVAATVAVLEGAGLDLVSPYPRQVAGSAAERVVQPLLQWSWLTFLPLRLAESSPQPSLAAANGQLLAVRTDAYRRAGGHAAIRGEVLDDVGLVRAVKATGGRGGVADGTDLARCRMYEDWPSLRDGYSKSLWAAFGSSRGAAAAMALLSWWYVLPAAAALTGSRVGTAGYAAGVAGRAVTARRTGGRVWPDALLHPVSVSVVVALTARSHREHRRGHLTWRGRSV